MLLYLLVIASGGPLPLVVHQFTCHHDATRHQPSSVEEVPPVCKHSCLHHHSANTGERDNAGNWDSNHDEECPLCYQLSQASAETYFAKAELIHLACCDALAFVDLFDLAAVDCLYPPRGPPTL